ncbi:MULTISPECIES: substrate import-associated zinc metallohydrolase lipoprotein [Sphingobacterium]|uniref:substrate import-associated zinc metallohydrolase lipoprotein n=1 Tax=Sphingobacterium TaxID=28453 RepID=UPI00257A1F11|nr:MULTISPECIES: substrate import-associated zinc metallohydrolase lipoprotein [Sphingobacterium]
MKTITKTYIIVGLIVSLYSCVKEEKLNTKIENYDTFVPGAIDEWITKNLTDPYNIEVVYRYQRNMHDINKNIAPADESKVIPQMDVVINGFLDVYKKIGGVPFIKTYTPKQFALFGSGDYDVDGSVKGGTADGGRRITLYGINNFDAVNPNSISGNLQVIHHEFTHILNQMRFIPAEFGKVCAGDYYSNWTAQENDQAKARSLGFITPYSRKSIGEDFAEVLSHLIVAGQLYYDDFAYDSGREAYPKFKQKESIVRDYMMQNFNIDVTQLQIEFQRVMTEKYNSTRYSAATALSSDYFGSLDWDIRNTWGLENTISNKQRSLFMAILDELGGWTTKSMTFQFVSATKATLNIGFGDNNVTYTASYDFDITKNADNTFKIAKSATQGTGNNYGNGNIDWVLKDTKPLIDYLGSTSFSTGWKQVDLTVNPSDYLQFLIFKDTKDPNATFIGKVNLRKY